MQDLKIDSVMKDDIFCERCVSYWSIIDGQLVKVLLYLFLERGNRILNHLKQFYIDVQADGHKKN